MHPNRERLQSHIPPTPQLRRLPGQAARSRNPLGALALMGLVCLSALLFASTGCKDGPGAARAATPAECRVVKNGTEMTSPISGKPIVKQATTPAAIWDGKLFFFCCEVDRDKFVSQPKTYVDTVLPPNGRILEAK
ncbi:MAG: hypothetical protein R3E97_12000 [Candidatus Eisenbacteria bacterium]